MEQFAYEAQKYPDPAYECPLMYINDDLLLLESTNTDFSKARNTITFYTIKKISL